MTEGPTRNTTCAIVVTYNPDPGLADRLRPALRQVGHVVVVDNASKVSPAQEVAQLGDEATFIANMANVGLGAALNQAIQAAIARGADWVLTLDDDSIVHDHMLETYRATLARHPDPDRVAMLGCNNWDMNRERVGAHPYYVRFTAMESCTLITSGSVLRTSAFRKTGPFREDFFIDWLDFEYNLRLARAGYVGLLCSEVLMDHSLGKPVRHRFPVRKLCNHHTPARQYFYTRNRAVSLREYKGQVPQDLTNIGVSAPKAIKHILLHEHDRLVRLRAVFLGLWHARKGRMGPAPASVLGGKHAAR